MRPGVLILLILVDRFIEDINYINSLWGQKLNRKQNKAGQDGGAAC